MKSYQLVEAGKPLVLREAPNPVPKGAEALLRITAAGVCHSDLHIADGFYEIGGGKRLNLLDRGIKLPLTMGHEVLGEVVALGPEAKGVKLGDRRLVYSWMGCGQCEVCRAGDEHLCVKPRTLGVYRDGGYADHVLVPEARYLIDVGGIPDAFAAVCACAGVTAYGAIRRAGPLKRGEWLAIIGTGGVGQMGVALARATLECQLVVLDVDDAKLEALEASGVRHALNPRDERTRAHLRELTGGGPMAAIDFVGSTETARLAVDSVRKGGRVVLIGLFGGEFTMPTPFFPLRHLAVMGSYTGNQKMTEEVIALARAGKLVPLPIETRPLARVNESLADLRAGRVKGRIVLTS